jgi:hypothetical protein
MQCLHLHRRARALALALGVPEGALAGLATAREDGARDAAGVGR